MIKSIDSTLEERAKTHGSFINVSYTAQGLKRVMGNNGGWVGLGGHQKESLEMIASKIARILNGDPNHADSWHDIAGYAKLVEDDLNGKR
tara:strand:+ start:193 stop:462 length:270 start_codon:yes stop_codon:yes gene_type:complete